MAQPPSIEEIENSDTIPFTDDEWGMLSQVHKLALWPVLRRALMRYQARALGVISDPRVSIEEIREAQGRLAVARLILSLLETDAPARYDLRNKNDENDTDDDS